MSLVNYVCKTGQHYENELFICSSKSDESFARKLYGILLHSHNVKAFFGRQSILWGHDVLHETEKAVVRCRNVLVIVSMSLLDSRDEQAVIGAILTRHISQQGSGLILPACLDMDQMYFKSNYPFLSRYQSVEASLNDPEGLAQLVVERLKG